MGDRLPLHPAMSAPRSRRRGTGDGGGDGFVGSGSEGKDGGRGAEEGRG